MLSEIQNIANDTNRYSYSEIYRYAGKRKIKEESVAEHSFIVALNIIEVCNVMGIADEIRDRAVVHGVLHDVPEEYIGDIPYETKSHQSFKDDFKELEERMNNKIYEKHYKNKFGKIMKEVMNSKNDIYDRLVKLADSMAVVQYSRREIELGNKTKRMNFIYEDAVKRVNYDYKRLLKAIEDGRE